MTFPKNNAIIISASLIVGISIVIAITSYKQDDPYELPQFSAKSEQELIQIIEAAYRKGEHYKILAYMDQRYTSEDMAELWATALSKGADPALRTSKTSITPWEEFDRRIGIPGSYKGKALAYNHTPEGVLSIFSASNSGRTKHQLYLAYYQENGEYRLCGTYYKK